MQWTELHAGMLGSAFERTLGKTELGSMAFVRCLTPVVVQALAGDTSFAPEGWQIWRVTDAADESSRSISADQAVEMRETKGDPVLLLVDTDLAGAGMDGIYSAALEIDETDLFAEALRLARREIRRQTTRARQEYADRAIKKARGHGRRFSVSLWTEFDFLCRVAAGKQEPGELLYLLGLWPVQELEESEGDTSLDQSRIFVDRLLGAAAATLTLAKRIETLRLREPSPDQMRDLEAFLRSAGRKPLLLALADLAEQPHLWVNGLAIQGSTQSIESILLLPWRTNTGKVAKWSGLIEGVDSDEPPSLILRNDAERTGNYSKLEIKWRAQPESLDKGAVEYRVAVMTEMEEELASKEVTHSAKKEEKIRFSNDDFSTLSEDALISAKVVVSVVGNELVKPQDSEEFLIRFGEPPELEQGGVGKTVRCLSEGLTELGDRESVSALAPARSADSKGFVILRTPQRGKSFRVFRPPLIKEVEEQWVAQSGAIGRWSVRVRASGTRAEPPEFLPFVDPNSEPKSLSGSLYDRLTSANRRMAERFSEGAGGVGQVYDENSKGFDTIVKEYLLAWTAALEEGRPNLSLAHTVEVQSLSRRTIGIIVLPSHPLRVAWLAAYDNLALHSAFAEGMKPNEIRDEFSLLDGAMFPAFLPGTEEGSSFVFADTLGFHAVGMVRDSDQEPKASVAILARALGETGAAETAPTVGKRSASVLANEVVKYLECHKTSRLLHVHALRPGDGLTVARALGGVRARYRNAPLEESLDEETEDTAPAFVLELYPSAGQRGVTGRFLSEAREKRRSGAGVLAAEDLWMLESLSLPGGVTLPRLRWARRSYQNPNTPAHLAIAFDTFESQVGAETDHVSAQLRPLYSFGLISFFERDYSSTPSPTWQSRIMPSGEGEKHPSDRVHSERLTRLQNVLLRLVAKHINADYNIPVLRTEILPAKAQSLRELHQKCDWVITLDRNAGVEYFDSPKDAKDIYDAYVIDCVPEREDLGCLQLITSTANLEEVRSLFDGALDQMGLSQSRRNAEFLLEQLKALSGRLAIRLTGQTAPTSELIALALCQANCRQASSDSDCWVSLDQGFIVPVDDVRDLLPPLATQERDANVKASRPDLVYVSVVPRKGMSFQFVEVKYRRHLRAARSSDGLRDIRQQVEALKTRWDEWYSHEGGSSSFRAVRRARLARVLRFYADKARRHYLPDSQHEVLVAEIDRMVEKGGDYSFAGVPAGDRGWVFCPDYAGAGPLEISPSGWETRVFLFGPGLLPDSDFRRPIIPPVNEDDAPGPERGADTEASEEALSGLGDSIESQSSEVVEPAISRTREESPSVSFGADALTDAEVRLSLTIQGNPHLLVAGLPGMGKTTCLLNLSKQMLEVGIRPIVFSYHEDIDERLEGLIDSVRYVDFRGLGFNPLQVMDRESRVAYLDVAGAMRDIFVAIFPELGDIQAERIRGAIKASFLELGWDDPNAVLADLREPEFKRFVEILRDDPKPDRGLKTLLVRLDELSDYGFFDLGETQQSLWDSERPVVVRIHATQNENLQRAFAALVFYGLYKDMFRRGVQDRITHAVIFDEAHRAAGLRLIPTMAKECRKYGIALVLASQEMPYRSGLQHFLVFRNRELSSPSID